MALAKNNLYHKGLLAEANTNEKRDVKIAISISWQPASSGCLNKSKIMALAKITFNTNGYWLKPTPMNSVMLNRHFPFHGSLLQLAALINPRSWL